ncbi:MAG: hypothetical protein OEY44_04815, partial [Candidatus Peregrinibacteria bacterium]|nr:hypothetical protein [Candidatus Peregrinibacteria bacterium]
MLRREVIPLKGELKLSLSLPGSKSITNRAFAIAALAKGKSRIYGALQSDDTKVMLGALEKLGVPVKVGRDFILIGGTRGQFKSGVL